MSVNGTSAPTSGSRDMERASKKARRSEAARCSRGLAPSERLYLLNLRIDEALLEARYSNIIGDRASEDRWMERATALIKRRMRVAEAIVQGTGRVNNKVTNPTP